MKKWKLTTKMTLWFALSVAMIVTLLFSAVYAAMATSLDHRLRVDLELAVEQIGAQVERSNGLLIYENETPIAPGISYFVMEQNGSELYSSGQDIATFDNVPIAKGAYTRAMSMDEPWLVLDAVPVSSDGETIRVRAAASWAESQRTLRTMLNIFLIGLPLTAGIAALAGYLLASRSLQPIRQIIACANEISEGNFERRVPAAPSQDELGELTDTLNRMLAAQEASIRRERQFTSDASHELRTPVAVMLAAAESLRTGELSDTQAAQTDAVLAECHRMQHIIEQMLTLTRAQEGRMTIMPEDFPLAEIFDGVHAAFSDVMEQKHITFACDVPPTLMLYADQSLITRLMLNLIENAIKYGKEGGHITCAARLRKHNCEITITDDGIGIAADDLPHVFDRFYRADTARDRSGTGLGLSIAKWIVEAHHGQISMQSHKNKGTTVTITLPM